MRRGRSRRAGDLKAGNITPPLVQTTTSVRLMLPTTVVGLGLAQDVAKLLDLLSSARKLETGFAPQASLLYGVEVDLELFELNTDVHVFGIEVAVLAYLASEPPVVIGDQGIME